MVRNLLERKSWLMTAVLLIASLVSCKTNLEMVPEKVQSTPDVNVNLLKDYLSSLANIKGGEIYYNEQTKMFSIGGVEQVDRDQLSKYYEISRNKQNDKKY